MELFGLVFDDTLFYVFLVVAVVVVIGRQFALKDEPSESSSTASTKKSAENIGSIGKFTVRNFQN